MKLLGVILLSLVVSISANAERWTMEKLVGMAPEFDGPSCYTAALLTKGYVDTMSFVGSKELEFFMDRFCSETSSAPQPGDLLALTPVQNSGVRAHTDHVAIYLGDHNVFEKEGGIGKFKPYAVQDPRFLVRPMKDSPWFRNYAGDRRTLNVYRCQDAKIVRAQTAACEARVNAMGMANLRKDFERIMLSTPARFNPSSENIAVIQAMTGALSNLEKIDPCYDYILAMGEMLGSAFMNFRVEHMVQMSGEWKNARAGLERILAQKYNIL